MPQTVKCIERNQPPCSLDAVTIRTESHPTGRLHRATRYVLLFGLPLASLAFAELMLPGGVIRRLFGSGSDDTSVKVTEERQGAITHVFLTTDNCLDITITVSATVQNMRVSPSLPAILDTRGQRRIELLQFEPSDSQRPPVIQYHYRWSYGCRGGKPDGTVYLLPYDNGTHHKLIQGYGGTFSHARGSPNEYSDDWDLAIGSIVRAARGGVVVGIRQDSNASGVGDRYLNSANYVIVRHSDGTYGEYLHLKQNGALVKLGEIVAAGQAIALSGNTGYTSRPHLHFSVFLVRADSSRQSLPVQFLTKDGQPETLEEGQTY